MKIAMITWGTGNYGITTYSRFLIGDLRKYVDVVIIPINKPFILNPFVKSNHFFDFSYIFKITKNILSITKQVNIIHIQDPTWTFAPLVYLTLLFRDKQKIVTTIHTTPETNQSKIVRIYGKIMSLFTAKFSDAIIVHTPEIKEIFEKYNPKKCGIILHGSYQDPIFWDRDRCKEKLGLKGKKVLTIFGFINREKGYETIINILPRLDDTVILLIAGGLTSPCLRSFKEYFETLKNDIKNDEQIKMTGYIQDRDIPIILNASDIMLLPYTRVAQSGILNIAIGYRKPIITSDLPYFREIEEKYNCIETARDETEFLEKIKELIENKKKREYLTKNAQNYIEETNWDTVARKHFEFYKELCKK